MLNISELMVYGVRLCYHMVTRVDIEGKGRIIGWMVIGY